MTALKKLAQEKETFTQWRRHLHQNPETAFEEFGTSDYIANLLESWGVEIHRGMATTAVVGVIRGAGGASKRAVALRADMDALNMSEETNLPYASKNSGKMHACGHDGHTAMLLAAAKHLAENRDFDGTVYTIFQPAEEGGGGGNVMVQEGFFDKFPCEAVFGMHNWPWMPAGTMAIAAGPVTAAADEFKVTLTGQGGHAAFPHATRDVVTCSAQIISALQHLVSRMTDPQHPAVVSITNINAGTGAHNVLPDTSVMSGTVRSFDAGLRKKLEQNFRQIVTTVAAAFDITADVQWMWGYPPTVNSPVETDFARETAKRIVGADNVHVFTPMMGAEDFAYFLEKSPGAYIVVGQGKTDNDPGLHTTHYDFNDDILPLGAAYWVELATGWLKRAA